MGVIIIFRNSPDKNLFREYLHALISLRGEKLIISSGFIAEGPSFSLVDQRNILPYLINATSRGLSKIIVIAGKFNTPFGRIYRQKFDNFADNLRFHFGRRVIKIPQKRWHAKVSIRISNGKPIAAIVGSSNLTTTAYGLTTGQNWNKECDIVMWNNKYTEATEKFSELYKEGKETIYFERIGGKFNEARRLNNLYEEIKDAVGKEYKDLI